MRGYCDDEYVISKTMDAGLVNAGQARKAILPVPSQGGVVSIPYLGDGSIAIN